MQADCAHESPRCPAVPDLPCGPVSSVADSGIQGLPPPLRLDVIQEFLRRVLVAVEAGALRVLTLLIETYII